MARIQELVKVSCARIKSFEPPEGFHLAFQAEKTAA